MNKKVLLVVIFMAILCMSVIGRNAVASASNYALGADSQHSTSFSGYRLPWVGGKTAILRQDGIGSHSNQLDFNLDGAEKIVTAAKAGTVIFAKYSSNVTSNNFDDWPYANMVVIQHGVNEYSWYVHLAQTQAYVHINEQIPTGTILGIQGNTGYVEGVTGNHLHFMVSSGYNDPGAGFPWNSPGSSDAIWTSTMGTVDFLEASWSNLQEGYSYTSQNYTSGVSLYLLNNYVGMLQHFDTHTYSPVEYGPGNTVNSILIAQGWSAKIYQNLFGTNFCLNQSTANLSTTVFWLGLGVRAVEVFDNPDCGGSTPPVCNLSPQSSQPGSLSLASVASDPCITPTPGPSPTPGPTPTPPPSGGNTWSAKVFSSINECNDSPNCNPSSTFYQTSVSGVNFNLNFANGRAFGAGTSDQWGMILNQTVNLPSGTYYLHADHDDGVKIWVNGQNRMDVLNNEENNTTCPGIYLSGATNLSILWKNTGGGARLNFSIDQNGSACQSSQKWHVWYYSDPNICSGPNCSLQQVFCERDISGTQFHINPYTPDNLCGSNDDTWGSMWKQTINFPEGDYVFYATHDDGVKIFLGDTNIMDVGNSEDNNRACPARHLNGDVPITVIHKNTGGDARIVVWWDTNTASCEQTAYNVWVEKNSSDVTSVRVENGDISKVNLYLARAGQPIEITRSRWTQESGSITAVIPSDVDAFLVDQGFVPTIGSGIADEWYNDTGDPHWVLKKKMFVWIDESGQTHLTYQGDHSRPQIRFYTSRSQEQLTTSLWQELADGSGIEAIIPETYEAIKIDRWIRPLVIESASTWWVERNYWLPKRVVTANLVADDTLRVYYYWGLPLPVTLGRYGQEIETREDLWQSESVDGHTNYYFDLPSDVVAFEIQGGPKPRLDNWAAWIWGNYSLGHWVSEKTTWVYKNADNSTQVFYANPEANPEDVPVIYYNYSDSTEHQTTSWWTKVDGGLSLKIPENIESFLITRGPAPYLTDSVNNEWRVVSEDGKWINHKWLRVWKDYWGKTYVTYWHEQAFKPNIHYWLNGEEVVTNTLWQNQGDGIQAKIPDDAVSFKVDIWNQPVIEASAQSTWKFSSLPDLWIELVTMPTPTVTPTSVTPSATVTPTTGPSPTATPTPVMNNFLYLPGIFK